MFIGEKRKTVSGKWKFWKENPREIKRLDAPNMSFPSKSFLFCVTMVLLLEVAHSDKANKKTTAKPDITIKTCGGGKVVLNVPSTGTDTFYVMTSKTKTAEKVTQANGELKINNPSNTPVTIIKVQKEKLLQKDSAFYDVDCSTGVIKNVDGNIKIDESKQKHTKVDMNLDAQIKFFKGNSQEIKSAALGDQITMQISAKNGDKLITIKSCKAMDPNDKKNGEIELWPNSKKNNIVKKHVLEGLKPTIEFEAFRFVFSNSGDLKFTCNVQICPTDQKCSVTTTPKKIHYEIETSSMKNSEIAAALTVFLPQNNAAAKASSHVYVFLALGAVLLQRQFS